MDAEVAERDSKSERIFTGNVVFVADVNVADLDLNVVDDLRGEFFGESFVFFGLVLSLKESLN